MQNLLQCVKRIKEFMSFRLNDKLLIIRIVILTAVARAAILIIPFRKLKTYIGELNKESTFNISQEEYNIARKIGWAIEKVSDHTPWESKCFVRALTAQYLLKHKKIDSTIYLGVAKEDNLLKNKNTQEISCDKASESKMIAHSWIRCGELYVTGGNGAGFAIVAKFKKGGCIK